MDNENNNMNQNNQDQHPYGNQAPLNPEINEQKSSGDWANGSEQYTNETQSQPNQGYDGRVYNNPNINKTSTFNQQGYQNGYNQQSYEENKNGNGFAIASMVLGIISLIVFCLGFNIILAILAIIFGAISLRKSDKRGMAIAGIVTGIISIVLFVLVCLVVGASFLTLMNDGNLDDFNELYEYYNNGGDLNEVPNTNDITDGLDGGTVNYEFDSNGATYTVYSD